MLKVHSLGKMATDADQVVQEATQFFFRVGFTSACTIKSLEVWTVRDGKIQGQCATKKTKERPCISPSLT